MKSSETNDERIRIESIGSDAKYASGVNSVITQFAFTQVLNYLSADVLELGPAEGVMTELIVSHGIDPVLVEGSKTLCLKLEEKFPRLEVNNCLFEEFESERKFDLIIMGHVLEHVEDPIQIIKKFSHFLKEGGRIWAAVPNANSIHRQVAVEMGLLKTVYELNEADITHGHRRVLDLQKLQDLFRDCEMKIEFLGGYWLKPLSNAQIEATWSLQMINSFAKLGTRYPEIAGEIVVVASL